VCTGDLNTKITKYPIKIKLCTYFFSKRADLLTTKIGALKKTLKKILKQPYKPK